MKVLVVEDEEPKRLKIRAALNEIVQGCEVTEARSVNSAIKLLRSGAPDLILLDMSLPTYDVGPTESGGEPRGFGGVEVLRYIDRFKMNVPVVVVTAYDAFGRDGGQIDLEGMKKQLLENHPNTFRGAVYFNSIYETWKEELHDLVQEVVGP